MTDLDAPSSSLRVAMVAELADVRVARASQSPSRAFYVRTCPSDSLSHAHYVPDSAAPPSAQSFLQNPYYFMFASLAKPDEDIELHWLKVRVHGLFRPSLLGVLVHQYEHAVTSPGTNRGPYPNRDTRFP